MTYRTLFNRRVGPFRIFADHERGYVSTGVSWSRPFYVRLDLFVIGIGLTWKGWEE